MSSTAAGIARRAVSRLLADPSRVITRLFVPGQEGFDNEDSRAASVVGRVLALDEEEAGRAFDDVVARFAGRHRSLIETFERHAEELAARLRHRSDLSPTRRKLLGAIFTSEYAIEGAAVCNPSVVAHPDQTGVASGALRFVMSVRGIGEGHRSSIGFRTGVVDAGGEVVIDAPSPFATTGQIETVSLEPAGFRGELQRIGQSGENDDYVFDGLGETFSAEQLERQLVSLQAQAATRMNGDRTVASIRAIASRTYGVRFGADTSLTERVLWPATNAECQGMEDARFVRFVDGDDVRYYATYTAYDGAEIRQQLLETTDFLSFTSSPIVGSAAANKGLALFPRQIGGRFAALSRSDRETNRVTFADNPHRWDVAYECQSPIRSWEVLQLGNCGSPIETEAGWLVLTHGVGPMRTYSIGAILLDLDDPTRLIGRLKEPLLSPGPDEQDGYVPNVVYSCGSLVHAGTLVLPYGIGDTSIGVATVAIPELLAKFNASE